MLRFTAGHAISLTIWTTRQRCFLIWKSFYFTSAFLLRSRLAIVTATSVFQIQIISLLVTWYRPLITRRLRAVHFPASWSHNASVSTSFHCTKRVNWTTQLKTTFLVTWWNRKEQFTWTWWCAVIIPVRACAVKTEARVWAVPAWSVNVLMDTVDFIVKVRTFLLS